MLLVWGPHWVERVRSIFSGKPSLPGPLPTLQLEKCL